MYFCFSWFILKDHLKWSIMTVDEFFCEVDREKYPDMKQRYRFEEGDVAPVALLFEPTGVETETR